MNKKFSEIIRIGGILLGSFISAIAINELYVPHKLLNGGVGGISLIIQYLTGFPAGAIILIMNIPIFLIGVKEIDRDFIIHSFIGTIALSIFMILFKEVPAFNYIDVDDTILSCIFGGALNGLGAGIVFRNRGSMGGSDIIAVIIKKHRSINIGTVLLIINIFITLLSSFLYGIKPAMYTLIAMYISSSVMDRLQEGFDRSKSVFIVSQKEDEVAQAIIEKLHRGVTYLYGEGVFTHTNKRVIYCVITTRQLAQLKHIVVSADPSAFVSVFDTAEVLGKGFIRKGI